MTEPMYIRQTETESIMGDRIVLYYFTQEKETVVDGKIVLRYGIGVDMYTQLPAERTIKERKIVEGIFPSRREAELFIDVLCRGCVTPSTLEDIINDNVDFAVS